MSTAPSIARYALADNPRKHPVRDHEPPYSLSLTDRVGRWLISQHDRAARKQQSHR